MNLNLRKMLCQNQLALINFKIFRLFSLFRLFRNLPSSVAKNLTQSIRVEIGSAENGDDVLTAQVFSLIDNGGNWRGARAFDHVMSRAPEHANRSDDFAVIDQDYLIHAIPDDVEGDLSRDARCHAIGDCPRLFRLDDVAGLP